MCLSASLTLQLEGIDVFVSELEGIDVFVSQSHLAAGGYRCVCQ